MRKIVLVGFMGCGKTTVGKVLARKLDCPLWDTDRLIEEEEGMTITELFAARGEEYFREKETEIIQKLAARTGMAVVATGGGLPVRMENHPYLRQLGFVVYLKVTKEAVLERLSGDNTRPLLAGYNPGEKIEKLLKQRGDKYRAVSDAVVNTESPSIEGIADEIIAENIG